MTVSNANTRASDVAPEGQCCTWKGCTMPQAVFSLLGGDGTPWAHVCGEHFSEYNKRFSGSGKDPTTWSEEALSAWVLAQGGADAVVDRVMQAAALRSSRCVVACE